MGNVIKLRCETCGYEQMFHIGGGMRDWDMSVIRNALAKEDVGQFDAYAAAGMKNASINRILGVCNKCKRFINLPSVICRMPDGTEKRIENHCPHCSSRWVEPILPDQTDERIDCPKCKKEVTVTLSGLWD